MTVPQLLLAARAVLDEASNRLNGWVLRWCWYILVSLVLVSVYSMSPWHHDSTEPPGWGPTSGLNPHTDHLTGCQYLSTGEGGITPRMAADGTHLGCRGTSR